ncbi:hypothetical protein VST7929_02931 [Vibrio stylophorae]|uniref:Uncharacterized protein n=1 Tax=Vibrio stylophorae TaxID=659351 RepID=A0ABM8ZXH2_9VIBR|nr:hypothetical protein [Vibrio stylophorae]CAH0535332.1 hypothetical protein VST7929_02931 [Vibrio stylophorae]
MIEHELLLQYAKDEDDYPVMLYLAKRGVSINWKDSIPDEVLYIPEELFQVVARGFVEKVGLEGYYGKTILTSTEIDLLCCEREVGEFPENFIVIFAIIKHFIDEGCKKVDTHYLAFEGP